MHPFISRLKQQLARPFVALRVEPNHFSLLGLTLTLGGFLLWITQPSYLAWVLMLVGVLSDFLDGEIARQQDRQSLWGNYLETLLDRSRESLTWCALYPFHPNLALGALILSFLISYSKARLALVILCDNHHWPTPCSYPERVIWNFSLLLSVLAFPLESLTLTLVATLLSLRFLWGLFARVRYAHQQIHAKDSQPLPYLNKKS